jgi:CubicO group peptidase (beta-lactamase class C family)
MTASLRPVPQRFAAAFLGVLAFALPSPAFAASEIEAITPAAAARLDAAVHDAAAKTPGLSVAVAEDGRVAYAHGVGFADVAAKRAVTPETRFRIASITKMFTAVSVMQLVERGQIGLDDRVARYLPDAPHAAEITIRQLLTHTSGLWNYGDEAFISGRVVTPTTPQAIVASAAAHPLTEKPGAGFAYTNTGYVLLGLVVEAVTREPLARYEAEHIYGPAGMHATTNGDPADGDVSRGYESAAGKPAPPFVTSWVYGDGDIVSTASDLARFDIALMSGKLVTPATFALMQSASVDASSIAPGVRYGLGLMIVSSGGVTFVGHHGGMPGFEAENEMLPSSSFAMAVLSNAFDYPTPLANQAVLSIAAPAILARAAAAAKTAAAADALPGPEDPAITMRLRAFFAALQLGEVDRAGATAEVNGALTADALAALKAQLGPLGSISSLTFVDRRNGGGVTRYRYRATFSSGKQLPITFALDADGKVAGFFFE